MVFYILGFFVKGIDRCEVKVEIELYYECVLNVKFYLIFFIMSVRWWYILIFLYWIGFI